MLDIRGISKRFGTLAALSDVSFGVPHGEVFGFVGGNGAGKSTTMRIVLGVLAADSGEVRWQGAPVDAVVRGRIGYMPEERGLYPKMKVGEQLRYLARLHGRSPADAAAATRQWTERLGVDGRVDDEVQKLSLGNQQRVQLCAALVHDPEVLVLDEPFSGLDPTAVEVMSTVLREKAATGVPVIFSSHQLELVERLCDRIGVISAGRMVAVGTVDELRSRDGSALVLDVDGPPAGWADSLPGAEVVEKDGVRTRIRLTGDLDDQAVLAAALAAGPVHGFTRHRPPLTEIYRDVVAAQEEEGMNAPLSSAQTIRLVARREFVTQVRSRSFVIGIVLSLVIFAVIGIITTFVAGRDSAKTLAVTGAAQNLRPALEAGASTQDLRLRIVDVTAADGRAQVAAGDADALLSGGPGSYALLGDEEVDSALTTVVSEATRQAEVTAALDRAGISTATVSNSGRVDVQTLQPVNPDRGQQLVLALVGTILLFMSLSGYGQLVATGVVEEKQSRVVELLLATVKPWQLLAGKVAGLGAVGLLQLVVLGAVGVGVSSVFGLLTVPSAALGMFAMTVLWYLLGFFLFASLYAAVGSTVSRQEDLNTVVAPMIFLLLIPFILTVNLAPRDPQSKIITVLSYVPFFSQTVMPARYALGAAAGWEVLVSALLAVLAIVVVVRTAGRVYRNSVLRTGARVSLREALRG